MRYNLSHETHFKLTSSVNQTLEEKDSDDYGNIISCMLRYLFSFVVVRCENYKNAHLKLI